VSSGEGETTTAESRVLRDAELGVVEARLRNGLTALVLQRPGSPVVSVQTWYRVGSREENKGQTGLAHFLEHLMFKGTDMMRKGDIDLVTLRNGGHNNADTTTDRTRYFFDFAADRWERALEIEADRMRGSIFDEHEFRAERGPVIEELRRDRDDPWWALHETLEATAYQVHPYRNPVIGWPEEIVKVPRDAVLAFYDAWYRPANCTIVVVGNVQADTVVARIEELFGELPGDPPPEIFVPAEPAQEGERRFELELEVNVPRLIAGFHTVRVRDPEDPVLDVLQVILSGGKSSVLYDRLVRRDRLASGVFASNDTRRDPGLFMVMADVAPGVAPEALEAALWEELERIATDGPELGAFERARAILRSGRVYRQATSSGMAAVLGTMQTMGGDWRLYLEQDRRVETITPEDVRDVAARFLVRRNRTVGWALPRPDGAPPRPPIPDHDLHELPDAPEDEREEPEIVRRRPTDRLRVELPARSVCLANGLRVMVLPRHDLPEVAIRIWADAGRLREAKPGTGALAGACLDEGAAGRTGTQIAELLAGMGAHLGCGAGGVSARCLTANLERVLDVVADVAQRPAFPVEAIEQKRGELIAQIRAEDDDPAATGLRRLRSEVYGTHPFARRAKGGEKELLALTRDDLVAHHRGLFVPSNAILAIVGDVETQVALDLVAERFGAWPGQETPAPELPELTVGAERVMHLEQDRDQLHVYLGHLGIRRDDPDYYPLLVADYVLGGGPGFTDRLSRTLRDEQGLAYSVYAHLARSADLEPGMFTAYIGTSPDARERAIAGLRHEIQRLASGDSPVTDGELDDARSYILGSFVFGFETNTGTAEQLVQLERLGLGLDYPDEFVASISAVTTDQIREALARHLQPDRLVCVTVGRGNGNAA
jgi:zinc protease